MASAISILHRRRQRQVSFLDTLATKLFLSLRHRIFFFFFLSKKVNLRFHVFFFHSPIFLLISKYLRNRVAIPQSYQYQSQWFTLNKKMIEQEAAALATRFALVLSSRQPRAMINYLSMEPWLTFWWKLLNSNFVSYKTTTRVLYMKVLL